MRRYVAMVAATAILGVAAAACSGGGSSTGTTTAGSAPNTSATSAPGTAGGSARDPQTVVDALDAAGLALCHSTDDDGHGNLYGAYANKYYFPHHMAENIQVGNTPETSCDTTDQPNTGKHPEWARVSLCRCRFQLTTGSQPEQQFANRLAVRERDH